MKTNKQGSALATVVIAVIILTLILTFLLKGSLTERRMNREAAVTLESRYAVEAVLEYATADLAQQFRTRNSLPSNALNGKTGSNPLRISSELINAYKTAGGPAANVKFQTGTYDPSKDWGTYDTEIIGGVVPPNVWYFVNRNAPGNDSDPLAGMRVLARNIKVYAKATAANDALGGHKKVSYGMQELQVRDAPLFANAIFYNMNMEIHPSPVMQIDGTVHSNGNINVSVGGGISFMRSVTAAGDIRWGRISTDYGSNDTAYVRYFSGKYGTKKDASGKDVPDYTKPILTDMKQGSTWVDSTYYDNSSGKPVVWKDKAIQLWGGNVQDAAHGVAKQNPVGIQDYVDDDPSTATANDDLNYAYQLIQPIQDKPATATPTYDEEIERQKFEYKAGLVVDINTTTNTASLYTYERVPTGSQTKWDSDAPIKYDSSGKPVKVALTTTDLSNIVGIKPYATAKDPSDSKKTIVTSGLYDKRRPTASNGQQVNLVEVDIGKLKNTVETADSSKWNVMPKEWWNGVVYVKLPLSTTTPRKDGVMPSIQRWGVKLTNAKELPDPGRPSSATSSTPAVSGFDDRLQRDVRGLTLATNNVVYIQGSYNADGDKNTGSTTSVDNPSDPTKEPPAAIAADAINVLSDNWVDNEQYSVQGKRAAASFNEVSAAFLTGLVPSGKYNSKDYSGGVENFPRFMEDWGGGRTFRYRGSMVSLFESEVASSAWKNADYSPPNRNWGFNQRFSDGLYPPGTPLVRSFRRVNFRFLTPAEWTKELNALKADTDYK